MPSFNGSNHQIKEPLGGSSLEDWPSFLENSPGEKMPPRFRVSRLEFIAASLLHLPGLVVLSILWMVFMVALVSGFILLTSWVIPERAFTANLTAVSPWGNDLGGWTNRKLYCNQPQPCDASNPFSEDSPSNLRYEIQREDEVTYVA